MKKFVSLLALICLSALLSGVSAPAKLKLVVATDASWPPMEMMGDNKEIIGFDIDLMKAVADRAGFTVVFKNIPWDGIFAGLDKGEYNAIISSITITTDRLKIMDFSTPYINAGQVLIVRSTENKITKLSQLAGKPVGAQIGTTGSLEIQKVKVCILKTYDEIGPAIDDLAVGKLECVVADTPIAANYALQNDKYKDKLKIVGNPFTMEFYGIAVKKGDRKTLEILNRGLKIVLHDQKLLDILEKKWLR